MRRDGQKGEGMGRKEKRRAERSRENKKQEEKSINYNPFNPQNHLVKTITMQRD